MPKKEEVDQKMKELQRQIDELNDEISRVCVCVSVRPRSMVGEWLSFLSFSEVRTSNAIMRTSIAGRTVS